MFAFLQLSQLSTGATLGYLCVVAGFLVIVASVVFVVKGKAVLGESGAPNAVEWGKIKTSLTSAVALFVLGAVLIAAVVARCHVGGKTAGGRVPVSSREGSAAGSGPTHRQDQRAWR